MAKPEVLHDGGGRGDFVQRRQFLHRVFDFRQRIRQVADSNGVILGHIVVPDVAANDRTADTVISGDMMVFQTKKVKRTSAGSCEDVKCHSHGRLISPRPERILDFLSFIHPGD
jgi:hypothetical protein